jgi:hypothetical protein
MKPCILYGTVLTPYEIPVSWGLDILVHSIAVSIGFLLIIFKGGGGNIFFPVTNANHV